MAYNNVPYQPNLHNYSPADFSKPKEHTLFISKEVRDNFTGVQTAMSDLSARVFNNSAAGTVRIEQTTKFDSLASGQRTHVMGELFAYGVNLVGLSVWIVPSRIGVTVAIDVSMFVYSYPNCAFVVTSSKLNGKAASDSGNAAALSAYHDSLQVLGYSNQSMSTFIQNFPTNKICHAKQGIRYAMDTEPGNFTDPAQLNFSVIDNNIQDTDPRCYSVWGFCTHAITGVVTILNPSPQYIQYMDDCANKRTRFFVNVSPKDNISGTSTIKATEIWA